MGSRSACVSKSAGRPYLEMDESVVHIGVLLGAGPPLSVRSKSELMKLTSDVFQKAQESLKNKNPPGMLLDEELLALTENLAILLENSPSTNAGKGSELNLEGSVECDACMILGGTKGQEVFAAAGAVPDLENPSRLCKKLIDLQCSMSRRQQPVAIPNFLVGSGAREYGLSLGLCRGNLHTDRAQRSYEKWSSKVSNDQTQQEYENLIDKYLDTVGLIVVSGDRVCVLSTSGGSLLKSPGRVGPAAQIGCGLDIGEETAAVCSGFGEDINTSRLAHRVASSLETIDSAVSGLRSPSLRLQRPPPYVGVLKFNYLSKYEALFEWYHTTESMTCAFGSVSNSSPPKFKHISSERPQGGGYKSRIS